MIGLLPSLLRP